MNNSKKIKIAIFDIDGTIFRSSLFIEVVEECVRMKLFPKKALTLIKKDYINWLDRKESYDKYIQKVVDVYWRYIKGVVKKDFNKAIGAVLRNQRDRNYRYTLALIKKLKKDAYVLLTISGSPNEVVSKFASYMRFDYSFGSIAEIDKDIYTGRPHKINSVNKKDVVIEQWSKQKGFIIDYKLSYAIGDSESDISILSKVGHPIAFNPSSGLARVARQKKWPIIVERKDMIYRINDYKFIHI